MAEKVILVDRENNEIGEEEKLKAHNDGKLHRAFSIFIFDSKGNLLLQQRDKEKYHSPKKWTNTVCSHPRPGESIEEAAHRRLYEEMGLKCELEKLFSFIYYAELEYGLKEHEYDIVFRGLIDESPVPNREEVMDYTWISLDNLEDNFRKNKESYTAWFRELFENEDFKKNIFY